MEKLKLRIEELQKEFQRLENQKQNIILQQLQIQGGINELNKLLSEEKDGEN